MDFEPSVFASARNNKQNLPLSFPGGLAFTKSNHETPLEFSATRARVDLTPALPANLQPRSTNFFCSLGSSDLLVGNRRRESSNRVRFCRALGFNHS